MKKIAALYTCYNRKKKTLASLHSLKEVVKTLDDDITFDIYLTDDGSTDGTFEEVSNKFPEVNIIKGDGNLFWAEGMRVSWKKALEKEYDGFLLINDDVEIYSNVINQLILTHNYCINTYNISGVYIGATEDKSENKLTYSGSIILNKFLYTQKRLAPNGNFQTCDIANANIMFVSKSVVDKIGILSEGYSHGMADYDYALTANKNNIPVLIAPEYCGHCINDHKDKYLDFEKKTYKQRKELLYSPTGLAFGSYKKYMKKFFPLRYPLIVFFGYFKLFFPRFYKEISTR